MKMCWIIFIMTVFTAVAFTETITLKTGDLEECITVSSFLSNTKGEIFLFARRTHKVFKFNKDGSFDKSFCRRGEGPGEIQRVLYMFHNRSNNHLYLPEYASGLGRVSVFNNDGKFKNYMDIELSQRAKKNIFKLIFFNDGTFCAIVTLRVDWEPKGNIFLTKETYSVFYFAPHGTLKATVYNTFQHGELPDS